MSEFKMMVNNQEEEDFFLSHLTKDMRVLEYGSGASTLAIAPLVKELMSIEHNEDWYRNISAQAPANVKLYFMKPDSEPKPEYDDGTYSDFESYIELPLILSKVRAGIIKANREGNQSAIKLLTSHISHLTHGFDVILIDGRARVGCASVCHLLGHKDTLVFIHDFNHPVEKWRRPEYYEAEKYLERIDGVFTMWKFKIKF